MMWCCLLVALLGVSGCSFGSWDSSRKPDQPDWLSVKTTQTRAGIVIERVTYRSGGLTIYGQVCRPASGGRHPVLISNHGGFSGIPDWDGLNGFCASAAKAGWVLAESSYRGEDGSDGRIEVCLGEVDDVLAMLEVVRSQSYADQDRIAMLGVSHGGCITSRAVERGADVHLAVEIAGPADWNTLMRSLSGSQQIQTGLVTTIEKAVGGTVEQFPERYAKRSPDVAKIARWDKPFLIMHGVDDTVVPVHQSCDLASRAGGFQAYRFDTQGAVVSQAPPGCDELTWRGSSSQSDEFNADRYLLVYDKVDHFLIANNGLTRMTADFFRFLEAKLPR